MHLVKEPRISLWSLIRFFTFDCEKKAEWQTCKVCWWINLYVALVIKFALITSIFSGLRKENRSGILYAKEKSLETAFWFLKLVQNKKKTNKQTKMKERKKTSCSEIRWPIVVLDPTVIFIRSNDTIATVVKTVILLSQIHF